MSFTIFKQVEPLGRAGDIAATRENDKNKNLSSSDAIVTVLNTTGKLLASAENLRHRANSQVLDQFIVDFKNFRREVLLIPGEAEAEERNIGFMPS